MSTSTQRRRNRTPRTRLETLATVVTWVFWIAVVATAATVIRTLTGQGPLFGACIGGPSPSLAGVCLTAAQALLQHTGAGLSHSGHHLARRLGSLARGLVAVMAGGLTLTELSERVGVSVVNLSILKNGRARAIRFSTLTRLCQALACQPGDLLSYHPAGGGTGASG